MPGSLSFEPFAIVLQCDGVLANDLMIPNRPPPRLQIDPENILLNRGTRHELSPPPCP